MIHFYKYLYYSLDRLLCPTGSSHTSMMMMIVFMLHYEFVQRDDKTVKRMHNVTQSQTKIPPSTG